MPKKYRKVMPKGSQDDAKMDAKFVQKSMRFGNLRFLVFCRVYNVKNVFLHDQGVQKSIKKQSQINAKSMLEKGMQKT